MRYIRYTYFKAHPRGYFVYDEIAKRAVGFYETQFAAIRRVLELNGIDGKNHLNPVA